MRDEYDTVAKRMASYSNWPQNHHITKEVAADAGFYFSGYSDCVRCFFCGGGLRHWEPEDDIRLEHARWFPKCQYLRQTMGPDFVEVVGELSRDNGQISMEAVQRELNRRNNLRSKLNSKL
ncbi:hypothetical protein EGW08_003608 [Elysia chlorotica]|uniref:Uncharacterized protein n=1 Tax=Elysia chlorotica TaxID=188477 RepID=A0A3S1CC57_ELYCH|nr:hypothetical protein EGW08_003608 [Elysia chlorotica]